MSGAVALPPDKRTRLVRLLGLLGSAFDGEVLAAARKAEELRRGLGVQWADIVQPTVPLAPPPPPPPPMPPPPSWQWSHAPHQLHAMALLRVGGWSEWERRFLNQIARQPTISPKQEAKLRELARQGARMRTAGGHL